MECRLGPSRSAHGQALSGGSGAMPPRKIFGVCLLYICFSRIWSQFIVEFLTQMHLETITYHKWPSVMQCQIFFFINLLIN